MGGTFEGDSELHIKKIIFTGVCNTASHLFTFRRAMFEESVINCRVRPLPPEELDSSGKL